MYSFGQKSFDSLKEYAVFCRCLMSLLCLQVIDWVLGPGERYLSTSKDIGDSVITCEILRKEHGEFEHNARVRQVLLTSCILEGWCTYILLEPQYFFQITYILIYFLLLNIGGNLMQLW